MTQPTMTMITAWSATRLFILGFFWSLAQSAWAVGEAASVTAVVGTVSAQSPDGKMRILAKGSLVMPGEIVMTEKGSTARLAFSDGGQATLSSASRLAIESYHYVPAEPGQDNAVVNLIKGGMRSLSGAVGKRGNQDAYQARTRVGTIGIRGTDFALMLCEPGGGCTKLELPKDLQAGGAAVDGLYFFVFEGAIQYSNAVSQATFPAGSGGYAHDAHSRWIDLPHGDPGLGRHIPAPGTHASTHKPTHDSACLVR